MLKSIRIQMNTKTCRRKLKDRRAKDLKQDRAFPYGGRGQPCRRVDDITVEDVFMGTFVRRRSL
jgi:hypothetical protein